MIFESLRSVLDLIFIMRLLRMRLHCAVTDLKEMHFYFEIHATTWFPVILDECTVRDCPVQLIDSLL